MIVLKRNRPQRSRFKKPLPDILFDVGLTRFLFKVLNFSFNCFRPVLVLVGGKIFKPFYGVVDVVHSCVSQRELMLYYLCEVFNFVFTFVHFIFRSHFKLLVRGFKSRATPNWEQKVDLIMLVSSRRQSVKTIICKPMTHVRHLFSLRYILSRVWYRLDYMRYQLDAEC